MSRAQNAPPSQSRAPEEDTAGQGVSKRAPDAEAGSAFTAVDVLLVLEEAKQHATQLNTSALAAHRAAHYPPEWNGA